MPATRQPTIHDVAREAGVSISTVSKYLTGRPYVSRETGMRVQRAVERLGFQPNGVGRALATGRTRVIGVVVASLTNPFYPELVEAIDREATKAGFSILVASTDRDPARERQVLAAILEKGADGFVLAHVSSSDRELLREVLRGKAYVLASRHFADVDDDYIVVDGAAGSRLAVDHLVELGHRRIAHVSGPESVIQFRWRRQGFLAGLHAHGLEARRELLLEAPDSDWLTVGARAVDELSSLPDDRRPTAVHTANDLVALGMLQHCREVGIRVPEDLSIVGFDDVLFGAMSAVPLTTVDSRIQDLGAGAARMIVDRLLGRADDGPKQVVLEPRLVVRGSSAPPPGGESINASGGEVT